MKIKVDNENLVLNSSTVESLCGKTVKEIILEEPITKENINNVIIFLQTSLPALKYESNT